MKIRATLLAVAVMSSATPALSADPVVKTLVIADTGFSATDPVIAAHAIYQLCIIEWNACPNGSNFQEGASSALLTSNQMAFNGFDHGSKMARAAIAAYPDVKIVLVRIIGQTSTGGRLATSESVITKVLTWVEKNSLTYNIGAVAISQGSTKIPSNARKCLSSPATEKAVSALRSRGIYSFFPAGNEGQTTSVNWPACIADSVSVGAIEKSGKISSYSNWAPGQVDLYEPGYVIDAASPSPYSPESGTSYSAQYAAAKWLSLVNHFPSIRPSLIYWNFILSGEPVENNKGQAGWSTDVDSVINTLGSLQR